MREETIRQFFQHRITAQALVREATNSVTHLDEITAHIAITDMECDFEITREHVLQLCDAGISALLSGEAITAIAFALIASDRFWWDGDNTFPDVLYDWSCPEVNFPMNQATFEMHKAWLIGTVEPPVRPPLPKPRTSGNLVTVRWKSTQRE